MDSNDIRERFPMSEENDNDNIAEVILDTRPPFCLTRDKQSGLDCLITVLRRIYSDSFLGPNGLARREWFAEAESENPILTHAWHMFGQGEEDVRKATEARSSLLRSLKDMGITGEEPFIDLDRSPLMSKTFWGQSDLVPFDPRFDAVTFEVIPYTKQEKGENSLVIVPPHHEADSMTVQQRFDTIFGLCDGDGQDYLLAPAQPEILRVEYHPAEEEVKRPPFDSFRIVDFPAWTSRREEDGKLTFCKTGRVPYTLIAVVRHRDEPTGKDSVRTYGADGANIVPEYEPNSYTPGNWSLEDAKAHTFTLYYRRSDPTMLPLELFPELDTRHVDIDFWRCVETSLQAPRPSQKRQVAASSRQEPKTAPPQREAPVTAPDRQSQGGPGQQAPRQGSEKDGRGTPGRGKNHEASGKKGNHELKRKRGDDRPAELDTRAPKRNVSGDGQDKGQAQSPLMKVPRKQAESHSRDGRSKRPEPRSRRESDRRDRDRGFDRRRDRDGSRERHGSRSKDYRGSNSYDSHERRDKED